jgi:hypothetical protein
VTVGGNTAGGKNGDGLVFSLKPPASPGGEWTETVLYRFTGGSDGATGGISNHGIVFAFHP